MIRSVLAQSAPQAEPVPYWWFSGEIEAGGRAFTNNPQKNGTASQGGQSLAKYYEYSDIKPGAFIDGHLSTGTNDGMYKIDLSGKNVGYADEKFNFDASKAGQQYFNFDWDQTPHNYGSGQTLYNGVGTNALTLPAGLSNTLFTDAGCTRIPNKPPTGCTNTIGTPQAAAVQNDINNNVHQIDLGIQRDTASAQYRWTPTDAWDIKADYSNTHRWGTQVEGVVFSPGTSGVVAQVPKPVDDTTQNIGLNGEYLGTSPWGQKFTFKAGYTGSVYQDASSSYSVANPFCATGSGPGECARGGTSATNGSPSSPLAMMSLWPDNQANGLNTTIGADLPLKSRYVGTVSYNMMRQNQAFLPFTSSALVYNGGTAAPYASMGAPPALPASSLNGAINTLLSNNVVTTQITPDLKSKLSYRYYNYDNGTPEFLFNDWVVTDTKLATSTNASYAPVNSLSPSYTKQNGDADLDWHPTNAWNLGGSYGYERYDWTLQSVSVTNENSAKFYVDWKPVAWLTTRASWLYGERRYDTYNYLADLGNFQWPNASASANATLNSVAMRQFYLDNRDRNKGQLSVSDDVMEGLTVTATFGYQDDVYDIGTGLVGLTRNQAWRGGVEVSYLVSPSTTFLFSYMNEHSKQNLLSTTATGTSALTAATTYNTGVVDTVHTFMGVINYAAIPDKLDLSLSYTLSLSKDSQPATASNGAAVNPQYPDTTGQWSRLDVMAKYKFDQAAAHQILGPGGEHYVKLRYSWERNSVNDYDNDIMQTYMFNLVSSTGYMTWLAYNNPNYNVQLVTASLGFKW
jgi:MtrB/PioB family decaheme-associated outer membrane protein